MLAYVGTNDSVVIPEKTTGIAKYAFRNNDSIRTVYIPSNVEYIDEYAFADCTGLKIVTFDNDNTYENPHDAAIISIGAFDNCRSLTNVILGSGVQYIDDEAFYFCESLATVYKGNIIKNLIMDCQSYTKYRPNETTGGIFVSWRRKEELPTGA